MSVVEIISSVISNISVFVLISSVYVFVLIVVFMVEFKKISKLVSNDSSSELIVVLVNALVVFTIFSLVISVSG